MLHHEHHPPDRGDVVEPVAVHGYNIRLLPLRQRTDPVRHPQGFRGHRRSAQQRIHGTAAMSSSGLPSTATISASFPSASEPIRSAIPRDSAATDVPLSNASMGLSPPSRTR